VGLIAQAQGGTLFLDEVQTMTPRAQIALLRFLQDYEYRPVGSKRTHSADVRIIASSNVDLKMLVKNGTFRQDLLFRLDLLSVSIPPLRERTGDPFILAENFVERFSQQYQQPVKHFDSESLLFLNGYDWPGNVRELENLIHREFILTDGPIIKIKNPKEETKNILESGNKILLHGELGFKKAKARAIAEFEKAYLSTLLLRTQGNISLAAKISGKERSALGKLVKKYGLERQQFAQPKQLS
jgi:DNA-binding NtrC family response regulator